MTGERNELDLFAGIPDPFAGGSGEVAASVDRLPAPPVLSTVPSLTRHDQRRRRAVAMAAAMAWQIVWLVAFEHRGDLRSLPVVRVALGVLVPLSAAAIAWGVAVRRGDRGLGAPRTWIAAAIVVAPLLFVVATLAVDPADHDASAGAFLNRAMRCAGVTAVLCAPLLAGIVFAFRRAFVAASTWRTAALGVACGAVAATTMSLVCPHDEAGHVLLGHGLFLLLGGLAGAALGKRVTRV
jgi:hypothetical protein